MPSSEPRRGCTFRATCPEGSVEWFARAPHLVGTPDLVAEVEAVLASRGSILNTVAGPLGYPEPDRGGIGQVTRLWVPNDETVG